MHWISAKFSKNQSAPKLENRKTSPCSPCAPNLLHVLVSRILGYHNLCSPGEKRAFSLQALGQSFQKQPKITCHNAMNSSWGQTSELKNVFNLRYLWVDFRVIYDKFIWIKNNLTFYMQREKFAIQEVQRLEERVPGASMSKDDDDLRWKCESFIVLLIFVHIFVTHDKCLEFCACSIF